MGFGVGKMDGTAAGGCWSLTAEADSDQQLTVLVWRCDNVTI